MVGMFLILIPYNYIIEENKGAKMDPPKKKKQQQRAKLLIPQEYRSLIAHSTQDA